MNGLEITMELLHFGIFSLVQQLRLFHAAIITGIDLTHHAVLIYGLNAQKFPITHVKLAQYVILQFSRGWSIIKGVRKSTAI
mgnify:CR=1 FL=1